jgi:hypothetical protein
MSMQQLFGIFILNLIFSTVNAQHSPVVLSSLKVMDIVDPSTQQSNNLMIEVKASLPLSLKHLEILLEESNAVMSTIYVPVVIQNGKAEVKIEQYTVPFEGNNVQFFLKVRDQFKEPYQRIIIKGYDQSDKETNQVVFNRNK